MKIIEDRLKFERFKIAAQEPIHFVQEFERQRRNSTSNIQAYDRTEDIHEDLTGRRRYSDYESFRRTRQRLKNR